MAEYISFQPSDYFNTTLYAGDSDAAGHAITGVGFQPDLVWIKARNEAQNHALNDSSRGVLKLIESDTTAAEDTASTGLSAFGADGFTVKNMGQINASGNNYSSWNWKAGTTSGLTGGTITPTAYSINTTACFSAIAYTGNYTSGATVPHGLGVKPNMILVKNLSTAVDWAVYSSVLGATKYMNLNTTGAAASATTRWNDTEPTSTLFSIGNTDLVNTNGDDYIAYCFASVKGYSKMGGYTGNGNSTFVYTGFKPAYLLLKVSSATNGWLILDSKRTTFNPMGIYNYANTNAVEFDGASQSKDFLSNGFKIRTDEAGFNADGGVYLYLAFAESPFKYANAR